MALFSMCIEEKWTIKSWNWVAREIMTSISFSLYNDEMCWISQQRSNRSYPSSYIQKFCPAAVAQLYQENRLNSNTNEIRALSLNHVVCVQINLPLLQSKSAEFSAQSSKCTAFCNKIAWKSKHGAKALVLFS